MEARVGPRQLFGILAERTGLIAKKGAVSARNSISSRYVSGGKDCYRIDALN
jgi:hypothetical protein